MLANLVLEDDFTTKNQACGEGWCCEQSPAPESKKEILCKINRKISVCSGCYNTDSWMGWLRQQEFISHSSEAGSPRAGCQLGQVLTKAIFLVCRWPFCYILLRWWERALVSSSSKGANPILEAPLSWPQINPILSHLFVSSLQEWRLQHKNLRETQTCHSPWQGGPETLSAISIDPIPNEKENEASKAIDRNTQSFLDTLKSYEPKPEGKTQIKLVLGMEAGLHASKGTEPLPWNLWPLIVT